MFGLPWYVYVLQFAGGSCLANGVPHFVQGISGHWFQSPFASPPVVNVLWGFVNLAVGLGLLLSFAPQGSELIVGWALVGLGVLLAALPLARHFGRVRNQRG